MQCATRLILVAPVATVNETVWRVELRMFAWHEAARSV